MRTDELHLKLAGVTRLAARSPKRTHDVFMFEPHRLAFCVWALRLLEEPALLVTFDRHLDLVRPQLPVPRKEEGLEALDRHARWNLDVRNYDHILAAMEAGLIQDAIVLARAVPRGAVEEAFYLDSRGEQHRILRAPSLDLLLQSENAALARQWLTEAPQVALDLDLDCFTTLSDADPTAVVPWSAELIRDFLLPEGSGLFWTTVLEKAACITLAMESAHCGGIKATHQLFAAFAPTFFETILGADVP